MREVRDREEGDESVVVVRGATNESMRWDETW